MRFIIEDFQAPREDNPLRLAHWLQRDHELEDALKNDAMKKEMLASLKPMKQAPLDVKIWILPKLVDRFYLASGTNELNGCWATDGVLWKLCVGDGWYETDDLRGYAQITAD